LIGGVCGLDDGGEVTKKSIKGSGHVSHGVNGLHFLVKGIRTFRNGEP
jgi:hypothetical protein